MEILLSDGSRCFPPLQFPTTIRAQVRRPGVTSLQELTLSNSQKEAGVRGNEMFFVENQSTYHWLDMLKEC